MSKNSAATKSGKCKITIGVPAYNEEKDIECVLAKIMEQRGSFEIVKILVVCDGCTDRTEHIVKKMQNKYPIIKLISYPIRRGKMAAINEILFLAKTRMVLIANADNLPSSGAINELLKKMIPGVGLVGARAICLMPNRPNLIQKINNLLWHWHHQIAMSDPKIVAFMMINRDAVQRIPVDCPIDEPLLEAAVRHQGYRVAYAPKAKLYLKPPSRLADYLMRRRSIHYGYYYMHKLEPDYVPSTMNNSRLFKMMLRDLWHKPVIVIAAALFEMYAKLMGAADYHSGKRGLELWEAAESSKGLDEIS